MICGIVSRFSQVKFSLQMDLRLFTLVLLVAIIFSPENQNLIMEVSDISLEVDEDNDLSWLTQSSPNKDKNVGKKSA